MELFSLNIGHEKLPNYIDLKKILSGVYACFSHGRHAGQAYAARWGEGHQFFYYLKGLSSEI
jgi:hypothetical protein